MQNEYGENLAFDIFRSEMCHMLKSKTDAGFIEYVLRNDLVTHYWNLKLYSKAFYVLAMLDYLAYIHNKDEFAPYNCYRKYKLQEPLFPKDVLLLEQLGEPDIKEDVVRECMQDECGRFFYKYNIIESNELIVKVKIYYKDVARVVRRGSKIRCNKITILE